MGPLQVETLYRRMHHVRMTHHDARLIAVMMRRGEVDVNWGRPLRPAQGRARQESPWWPKDPPTAALSGSDAVPTQLLLLLSFCARG
jgi:hypothetical protein